jgi:methylmalonyl-CoA/ethylmalonyl-CoA epimerase
VAIPAKDIDRATHFYRDILGLPLLMNGPNIPFVDCGGTRRYLDANPSPVEAGKNSMIYFRAANLSERIPRSNT